MVLRLRFLFSISSIPRKNFAFLYRLLDLVIIPPLLLLAQLSRLVVPLPNVILFGLVLDVGLDCTLLTKKQRRVNNSAASSGPSTSQPSSSLTSATLPEEGGVRVPAELTPVIKEMIEWVSTPAKSRAPRVAAGAACLGVGGCRTQTNAKHQS